MVTIDNIASTDDKSLLIQRDYYDFPSILSGEHFSYGNDYSLLNIEIKDVIMKKYFTTFHFSGGSLNCIFIECKFVRCAFIGTDLSKCRFVDCIFTGCSFHMSSRPGRMFYCDMDSKTESTIH